MDSKDADIIRLETTLQGVKLNSGSRIASTDRHVCRILSHAWSTGAYVIRRDITPFLLAAPLRYHRPVDSFLFDSRLSPVAKALAVYQLSPAVAIQDKFVDDTDPSKRRFESLIETFAPRRPGFIRRPEWLRAAARRVAGRQIVPFCA